MPGQFPYIFRNRVRTPLAPHSFEFAGRQFSSANCDEDAAQSKQKTFEHNRLTGITLRAMRIRISPSLDAK